MPAAPRQQSGGDNPEFIVRDFQGMNTLASREAIEDNEFWWLENVQPIAAAKMPVLGLPAGPVQQIGGPDFEVGNPSYTMTYNQGGTDYVFAVWSNSGNAYVAPVSGSFASYNRIFTGTLTSGQTQATPWNNQGLLIVDPTGYWDWNVTAANTLTPQVNSAASLTVVGMAGMVAGGTSLKQTLSVHGTGGSFQTVYAVVLASVNAAGSGYAVGETVTLTDNNPTEPASIVITSVNGSGGVTGITLSTGGSYPGPTSSTAVATGPSGTTVTGTGGTGLTFTVTIQATACNILTQGYNYATGDTVSDYNGSTLLDQFSLAPSGVIGGTSIATYAGRVWIGYKRTVSFTDVDSYSSFGGVGGSFPINDSYLHKYITAIFNANNYLYIFGDTSIDVLSNVTVSSGNTSFSRVNLTGSVGTSQPNSVFQYLRGLAFQHATGFYLLSGATPEKMSEKISAIVAAIVPGTPIYGLAVAVNAELCAAFMVTITDTFTVSAPGIQRTLLVLYFRNRWFVASFGGYNLSGFISVPVLGVQTAYFWANSKLYEAFAGSPSAWIVKTRLWDAGSALREKQAINAAIACNFEGQATSGVQIYIDTEQGSELANGGDLGFPQLTWVNASGTPFTWINGAGQAFSWEATPVGYYLAQTVVQEGGSQYLGMTVTGQSDVSNINLLALRGKQDRDMLT
jgi:hypothetical protein